MGPRMCEWGRLHVFGMDITGVDRVSERCWARLVARGRCRMGSCSRAGVGRGRGAASLCRCLCCRSSRSWWSCGLGAISLAWVCVTGLGIGKSSVLLLGYAVVFGLIERV